MALARYREEARIKEEELKSWNQEWNESIRTLRYSSSLYRKYLTEIDAIFAEILAPETSYLLNRSQNSQTLRIDIQKYQRVLKDELTQFNFWFDEEKNAASSVQPDKFRHVMLAARALKKWNNSAQFFDTNPDNFYQNQRHFYQKATDSGLSPKAKIAGIVITVNFMALALTIGMVAAVTAGFTGGGSLFVFAMMGLFGYGMGGIFLPIIAGKEAYEHYKPVMKSNQTGEKVSTHSMFKNEDKISSNPEQSRQYRTWNPIKFISV